MTSSPKLTYIVTFEIAIPEEDINLKPKGNIGDKSTLIIMKSKLLGPYRISLTLDHELIVPDPFTPWTMESDDGRWLFFRVQLDGPISIKTISL